MSSEDTCFQRFYEFWAHECGLNDTVKHIPQHERRSLKDFYALPFRLEFTLFFGACLCFDSVLFIITLPLTLFVHLIRFRFKEFTFDSIRFVAYCVVVSCLDEWLNFGKYYHIIRVQSMFSLFLIFNLIYFFDSLLHAFGEDVLDSLYYSLTGLSKCRPWFFTIYSSGALVAYLLVHSTLLLIQLMALQVVINEGSLIALLISNNLIELQSAVFKKFDITIVGKVVSDDCCERFRLTFYIFQLHILNWATLKPDEFYATIQNKFWIWIIVAEVIVDMLKHNFILQINTKNRINMYYSFQTRLAQDVLQNQAHGSDLSLYKRLGFVNLPYACMLSKVLLQSHSYLGLASWRYQLIGAAFVTAIFVKKVILSIIISFFVRQFQDARSAKIAEGVEKLEHMRRWQFPKSQKTHQK